jgi:hypothetical protein
MAKEPMTIPSGKQKKLFNKLGEANAAFQKLYPGERKERQPVHTVYGGANLFKADTARVLGERALQSFNTYAPDFITFGKIFQLDGMNMITGSSESIRNSYESLTPLERKKTSCVAFI